MAVNSQQAHLQNPIVPLQYRKAQLPYGVQVAGAAEYVLEERCTHRGILGGGLLEHPVFVHRVLELLGGSPRGTAAHVAKAAAPLALRVRLWRLCGNSVVASSLVAHMAVVRLF